jgi:hypothetical protein
LIAQLTSPAPISGSLHLGLLALRRHSVVRLHYASFVISSATGNIRIQVHLKLWIDDVDFNSPFKVEIASSATKEEVICNVLNQAGGSAKSLLHDKYTLYRESLNLHNRERVSQARVEDGEVYMICDRGDPHFCCNQDEPHSIVDCVLLCS